MELKSVVILIAVFTLFWLIVGAQRANSRYSKEEFRHMRARAASGGNILNVIYNMIAGNIRSKAGSGTPDSYVSSGFKFHKKSKTIRPSGRFK